MAIPMDTTAPDSAHLTWELIASDIQKVGWRTMDNRTYRLPHGVEGIFTVMNVAGMRCGGCIALTPDNMVIVARQFRPGPAQIMDELPGGVVEPGEDPAAAVARELEEETGYRAGAMTPLGILHRDAYVAGEWHYYLATDCVSLPTGQQLDSTESIEVHLLTIEQFLHNATVGRMTDPGAVLLAYEELKKRQRG